MGYREHRCELGDNAKRFRSNQCWPWESNCVCADIESHGCLQCFQRNPQPSGPELLVLFSESGRCAEGIQGFAGVQGCCEGGPEVKAAGGEEAMYSFCADHGA